MVVQGNPGTEVKEETFYEVKLKKAASLKEVFPVVKSTEIEIRMTWGKKEQLVTEEVLSAKKEEARIFAREQMGEENVLSIDEAVISAKKKKANKLVSSWGYLLYNSKFSQQFGSGVLAVYSGSKVRIINHKTTEYDELEENSFVLFKKFSVDSKEEVFPNEESSIECDSNTRADALLALYNLDHKKSQSNAVIGHVASVESNFFNPKTGKKYANGRYVVLTLEDKVAKNMVTYRVWSENIRYVHFL